MCIGKWRKCQTPYRILIKMNTYYRTAVNLVNHVLAYSTPFLRDLFTQNIIRSIVLYCTVFVRLVLYRMSRLWEIPNSFSTHCCGSSHVLELDLLTMYVHVPLSLWKIDFSMQTWGGEARSRVRVVKCRENIFEGPLCCTVSCREGRRLGSCKN